MSRTYINIKNRGIFRHPQTFSTKRVESQAAYDLLNEGHKLTNRHSARAFSKFNFNLPDVYHDLSFSNYPSKEVLKNKHYKS